MQLHTIIHWGCNPVKCKDQQFGRQSCCFPHNVVKENMCTDWWVRHDINIERGWNDKNSSVRNINMGWLLLRMDLYHQPLPHLLVLHSLLISIYLRIFMRDENATIWTWATGIFRVQDWSQAASDRSRCLSILHTIQPLHFSSAHG